MATELSAFLRNKIESFSVKPVVYDYGTVSRVGDGVARVTGLPGRCYGELLQFESGALGYHFGTWGARGTKMGYDFQAHCEQGLIQLDYYGGKLIFRCKDPEHVPGQAVTSEETVLMEFPKAKPTAEEMAHFIDCIETGKTPETTPEDSLQGLRVIWKLYEAEDAGRLADLRGLGFSGEKK